MTKQLDDGGPAFPWMERVEDWTHRQSYEPPEVHYIVREGMTMRDYFAAQVAPTLVACHRADVPWAEIGPLAYRIADALLAARKES